MQASYWIHKRVRMCALRMWSEVRIQMYRHEIETACYFIPSNTYTKTISTQHTTKIVINETCRLITVDVEDHYVNTPINAKLYITEILLTINSTATSVQQITSLLHRVLRQYYFQFSYNYSKLWKLFPWETLFLVW
jgi:hypothetical protein